MISRLASTTPLQRRPNFSFDVLTSAFLCSCPFAPPHSTRGTPTVNVPLQRAGVLDRLRPTSVRVRYRSQRVCARVRIVSCHSACEGFETMRACVRARARARVRAYARAYVRA
eukprot:2036889-Pleurochrysis_carterae.AAC.1